MTCGALAFASMSACSHALQGRADWRVVAVTRAAVAFLLTFAAAVGFRRKLVWPGPKTLWVRSLVGSAGMLLTFYSLLTMPIANAVTLTNTFPLWVAVLSWPVLGERPSAAVWVALASGMAGVALIEQPGADGFRPAAILALLAAVCASVVMLGLHRLKRLDPMAVVVHFGLISTLVCLGYALATGPVPIPADGPSWLLLLATGSFAAVGQVAMTRAFQCGPPEKVAVFGLLQPVFALGYGILLWGYEVEWPLIAGVGLVVAPAAWLTARAKAGSRLGVVRPRGKPGEIVRAVDATVTPGCPGAKSV